MGMSPEQALADAEKRSKFLKIASGQEVEGCFVGDLKSKEFENKTTGEKNIGYGAMFRTKDGIVKEFTISAALLRQCMEAIRMAKTTWNNADFTIKRKGEGLNTKWFVHAVNSGRQEPVKEPEVDDVPF